MPVDILLALLVLAGTVLVLATGVLRVDVVALLALVLVALLGLIPYGEALAGFASPAVITIGGMFVISAGLSRTGVAEILGRWLIRAAGQSELRVLTAVTLVSGLLSGFMNNVGVAAMMLPVVVTVARQTAVPPSKLLIPMAFGAQLGGFTTLVGTAPNLVAAEALREAGLEPFGLFSYTPVGLVLLAVGTGMVALLGPRLLPERVPATRPRRADGPGIRGDVDLSERLFILTVPRHSLLEGKTLASSLIGSALGVHVLAVRRDGMTHRAPGPEMVLAGGDRIIVQGRPDYFLELRGRRHVAVDDETVSPEWLESREVGLATARVSPGGDWVGKSAFDLDLRARSGILILSLRRGVDVRVRTHLVDAPLRAGDVVLLQGAKDRLEELGKGTDVDGLELVEPERAFREFDLQSRLWALRVTPDSLLEGRTLGDTRLGEAAGFLVLAVAREKEPDGREIHVLPGPSFELRRGDHLMVKARPEDLAVLRGLQRLGVDLETDVAPELLEGGDAGFVEAVVAPHSSLVGKTLRQVNFRDRFGLHVVAVVREGGVVRADLREEVLRFGDALLLYGLRRHQRALAGEPDLILLHSPELDAPHFRLAPLSIFVTVAALAPVMIGWVPVPVGVLGGAILMVLTRCLSPEEAYRAIHLPLLVLVAGMLALGAALAETGALDLAGSALLDSLGGFGPHAVLVGLVIVAGLAGQVLPGVALVVLIAPVAVTSAEALGVSPHPFVMAAGIAATSVASPISAPAHALTMAPAGYRMSDYLRLGVPVTLVVLLLTALVTPLFLPLRVP